ncbi:kinase-like domain-containing protein [Thamnocephalis sphaerospora]|uniref:Kinase-like domain-containing protein n=1 Tax=Thamnocephalis sphaerospora TaxID=78915 RepID=A0A4P9XR75_9FUNG|nr:kinase-like domain-containing protein [Thamnocephalis sphaerospora]|eukprot:RKP08558.1 kinase-like domain-containing protein [Thamnocephalis sphaerospora]
MRTLAARTIFAIAAVALLSSDLSCAGPAQSGASSSSSASLQAPAQPDLPPDYDSLRANPAQSTASIVSESNWPNQPDLYIVKWHPEGEKGMRTAVVDYSGVNGLLKCTPHLDQYNNEVAALTVFNDVLQDIVELRVPKILDMFRTNDNYHCLVLEMINTYSLREYVSMMPEYLRDVAVFRIAPYISYAIHFVHKCRFIHGNITPDTIYCQVNEETDTVRLILTGFEGSQAWSNSTQPSVVKPKGYVPPEDYTEPEVNQRLRDSWMVGATLYALVNGHPPYGFVHSKKHKAMLPVPTKELEKTMEQVAETGNNTYPPIKTKSEALIKQIGWLMEPLPQYRSDVSRIYWKTRLDPDIIRVTKKQNMKAHWDHLKSKLPIIGTPSWQVEPPQSSRVEDTYTQFPQIQRIEDTSTRYKHP